MPKKTSMIVDIPNKSDFENSGVSLLNLAWDAIAALYRSLDDAGLQEWNENGEIDSEFWEAAQRPISVSVALAQQGIELLLKGKIADVSPFLLLAGSPRDWPTNCSKNDIPFADFRTIDAQELIRAHDTVSSVKLTDNFKNQIDTLRRLRNVIFHNVHNNKFSPEYVFSVILEASHNLIKPFAWIELRRKYLENTPESQAFSVDYVESVVILEFLKVISLLKPSECKRLLGFDKKQRSYICYSCAMELREIGIKPRIAQLRPNTPESTKLYCFVCDKESNVIREDCPHEECEGNVLDAEDRLCLTCYD